MEYLRKVGWCRGGGVTSFARDVRRPTTYEGDVRNAKKKKTLQENVRAMVVEITLNICSEKGEKMGVTLSSSVKGTDPAPTAKRVARSNPKRSAHTEENLAGR